MRAAAILKDATIPRRCSPTTAPAKAVRRDRACSARVVESSARLASNFFADDAVLGSGQPADDRLVRHAAAAVLRRQLRAQHRLLSLGAPVGEHADWTVRGALTQGDIASWIVAGDYTTRAPARHRYDIGLSYSTQRYDGGNVAALRDVDRRQPQRRRDLRVRHLRDHAASLTSTYGAPLRALRLPRERQPGQPARRRDAVARPSTFGSPRMVSQPRRRAWRRGIPAARRQRHAGCRRSARSRRS